VIFEIEISVQADNDLRKIYQYIAYELQLSEMPKVSLIDWKKAF
jgi:hypothetical protein